MNNLEHMGHKMKDIDGVATAGPSDKNKMMYPSLHLSHKIPSDLKDKDVGDMCLFKILGKVVSKSENDMGEDMTIEVHKMGYLGEGKVSKDEYDKMSSDEKDQADEEDVMGKDE